MTLAFYMDEHILQEVRSQPTPNPSQPTPNPSQPTPNPSQEGRGSQKSVGAE